ncbi:MAG: alpha/beta fold hydrolase [Anaerolineae bacterium]|nr:alpha/beta fold hydrolase [Anaerolineae bacterium]
MLTVLLTGCAGYAGEIQAQLPQPSPVSTELAATTPTATPTSTPLSIPTNSPTPPPTATATATTTPRPPSATPTPTPTPLHPLTIEWLRQQTYPGSDLTIEETLEPGANYARYIAAYRSEGLKIYALLTVPTGEKPPSGWPVIVFNHGYIPPDQYRTTERYVDYVDALARNGYIVLKSDYRGHGASAGEATGGYDSPVYTIDVLNAIASLKKYPEADPNRIGMWGHSMGGQVTLRAMVAAKEDIKAGVIWAGVVASYPDLLAQWRQPNHDHPEAEQNSHRQWREELVAEYGSPAENPEFWASISPNAYLADLSGPIQLHHSLADTHVPVEFSENLSTQLQDAGQTVEYFTYENDDHNISHNFSLAMERSLAFFDKYVKGE